mmetsp:Transcript_7128/g.15506  ORF Transcript_7128/g.15506 Transcript_7128/m.15506 type:complete len:329 (-) Transcript_7128:2283-3269(-)
MLQALVEGRSHEYQSVERAPCVSVVQALVAVLLVAQVGHLGGYFLHREVVHEGGGVSLVPQEGGDLTQQTLHQMADRHAGGDGVRVDNDVGADALAREGHVFLAVGHSDGTLLSVAGGKLVSYLRDPYVTNAHLGELVAILVGGQHHPVHDARLVGPHRCAVVLARHRGALRVWPLDSIGHRFADQHVIVTNALTRLGQAVWPQFVIRASLLLIHVHSRFLERLVCEGVVRARSALGLGVVGTEEGRPEQSSVDGGLVHDERVLLVVARVAGNTHDAVDPRGQFSEVHVVHSACCGEGLLGVVQHVRHGVHAYLEGGQVDAHGLLAHG